MFSLLSKTWQGRHIFNLSLRPHYSPLNTVKPLNAFPLHWKCFPACSLTCRPAALGLSYLQLILHPRQPHLALQPQTCPMLPLPRSPDSSSKGTVPLTCCPNDQQLQDQCLALERWLSIWELRAWTCISTVIVSFSPLLSDLILVPSLMTGFTKVLDTSLQVGLVPTHTGLCWVQFKVGFPCSRFLL